MRKKWVEPKSIAEAQQRRGKVLSAIRQLQAELASQSHVERESGRRISRQEFNDIREELQYTLDRKYTENRLLKEWLAQHREEGTTAAYGIPTSGLMGLVTKRIEILEAVMVAAQAVLKEASVDNQEHLQRCIDKAREKAVFEESVPV